MLEPFVRKYKKFPVRAIVSDLIFIAGAFYFGAKSTKFLIAYLVLALIYTICEHTMGFDDGLDTRW